MGLRIHNLFALLSIFQDLLISEYFFHLSFDNIIHIQISIIMKSIQPLLISRILLFKQPDHILFSFHDQIAIILGTIFKRILLRSSRRVYQSGHMHCISTEPFHFYSMIIYHMSIKPIIMEHFLVTLIFKILFQFLDQFITFSTIVNKHTWSFPKIYIRTNKY